MTASAGAPTSLADWEAAWAPYDADTYAAALAFLRPDDVVLDIGAGDLRFARLAASRVRRVIAVEKNWAVLPYPQPLSQKERGESRMVSTLPLSQRERGEFWIDSLLPLSQRERGSGGEGEIQIICADALTWPIPPGVTVGMLLMRHCRHYREYATRLRVAGSQRLITNARWGMGVEEVRLDAPRSPYRDIHSRWYACECGAVGFAPGPVAAITREALEEVVEVIGCPVCRESSE